MGILFIALLFGAVFGVLAFIAGALLIDIYAGALAGFLTLLGSTATLGLVMTLLKAYEDGRAERYIHKQLGGSALFTGVANLIGDGGIREFRLFLSERELRFVRYSRQELSISLSDIDKALAAPVRTGHMEGVRLLLKNGREVLFTMADHARLILLLRDTIDKEREKPEAEPNNES